MNWNRNGKKKEQWEMEHNLFQRCTINLRVWVRKFQRETKGLGILLIILMGVMVLMQVLGPFLQAWMGDSFKSEKEKQIEQQAYCFKYGCASRV